MAFKSALAAAALLLAMTGVSFAGDAPPQATLSYPAAYFADAHPNTAYDMIQRVPGFTFDDGGSARGFAGNAGNVLIDGQRPTAKTDDLQSILNRIPAGDVDHIDLIRGNVTGIDMHGQTVVANVVRKKAASTTIIASVSDNIWLTGHNVPEAKVQFTRHADGWLYEASLDRTGNLDDAYGTGTHALIDPSGAVTHQRAYYNGVGAGWQFNAALTMPLFGGSLKSNITLVDSPFHDGFTYTASGFRQDIYDDSGDYKLESGLHWTRDWTNFSLNALLLERLEHSTDLSSSLQPGDDELFTSTSNSGETIGRVTLRYTGIPDLALEAGGEGVYNRLAAVSAYSQNGTAIALPSADANVYEQRNEAFIEGTWKMSPEWSLLAGARFETSTISETGLAAQSRTFFYPKPRFTLTWSPDSNTQVRLKVEKILGQLDFNNFIASSSLSSNVVSAGNPDLRPDQRLDYSLAVEKHFWRSGSVTATLLHEEITDATDRVPIVSGGQVFDAPGNIGSGRNDQIQVDTSLPLDWLGLKGGLLKDTTIWRDSAVTDPVTHLSRRISGQRPQENDVSISQDLPEWKSTWELDYFGGWDENYYRVTSQQHRWIAPHYLQLSWEYKPDAQWSLRAEADDIIPFVFNEKFISYVNERGSSPIAQVERISIHSQPRLFLRLRRTFD